MDDPVTRREALAGAHIVADPRKFRDYVLVPGHSSGKDRIFLGTLGFRSRSTVDAWALARLYEEQAHERVGSGDIQYAGTIVFGDRYTIEITVRGVSSWTGWLLSEDELRLIAPFSGFPRGNSKG